MVHHLKQFSWIHHPIRVKYFTRSPDGVHAQRTFFSRKIRGMIGPDAMLVGDRTSKFLDGQAGPLFYFLPGGQQFIRVSMPRE
jgi:hypothetical protein